MVDKLVVSTKKAETIIEMLNEQGLSYLCHLGDNEYRVVYFSNSRQCLFEGTLTKDQLEQIAKNSRQVSKLAIDEAAGKIIIEED